jgi:iron(II)-dependent oxidoreductase
MEITWILIPGGTCLFGDEAKPIEIGSLYWTSTTITRDAGLPLTYLDQSEADTLARIMGGRLPRSAEWEWMASGKDRRRFPWGDQPWDPVRANLRGSGFGRPRPVGEHPSGATPEGLQDVGGNV